MNIKAIETSYNGYRFRSRLEARWAVFFDAMGIQYEYEPEGFELGIHGRYLPDFFLPQYDRFVGVYLTNVQRGATFLEQTSSCNLVKRHQTCSQIIHNQEQVDEARVDSKRFFNFSVEDNLILTPYPYYPSKSMLEITASSPQKDFFYGVALGGFDNPYEAFQGFIEWCHDYPEERSWLLNQYMKAVGKSRAARFEGRAK